MALLNFSLPFHSANFAPEPLFNIPPPTAAIPPAPLPSAAEINSLYTPTSHQHRRQVMHPRRSTGHYRPSSASSYASASVQNALPRSNNRNQLQSQQRGYSSRKEKNSPPAPPSTASPKFSESDNNKGSHTLHAVIDYDDYDEVLTSDVNGNGVTPIQGPILLKNGTVPVVPLYSYPVAKNGSFVQIPIMWTALSLALGLEIRGEIIRGVPCIKRFHQLFCPTAGNSYPIDRIERFIDENKALMKRMYGEFQMTPDYGSTQSRGPGPELFETKRSMVKREAGGGPGGTNAAPSQSYEGHPGSGDSYFASQARRTRQSSGTSSTGPTTSTPLRNNQSSESGRLDACESKVEIVTPYWASNSAGKIRAIVNTQHFEQAIHQEVCSSKVQTKRCSGDCGCEQKYKWHRLLAYDPDNDCKGIFMDWFLFPSCCVCRCDPFDGK